MSVVPFKSACLKIIDPVLPLLSVCDTFILLLSDPALWPAAPSIVAFKLAYVSSASSPILTPTLEPIASPFSTVGSNSYVLEVVSVEISVSVLPSAG